MIDPVRPLALLLLASSIASAESGAPLGNPLPATDLSLTVVDSPDPIPAWTNTPLSYHAVITNLGPADAIGTRVSLQMSEHVDLYGALPPGCVYDGHGYTCFYPLIAAGDSVEVTVMARPAGTSETITPQPAYVVAENPDPQPANNAVTTTTTVVPIVFARCPSDVAEGNAGFTVATCTLEVGGQHANPVVVTYAFEGTTATPGVDFVPSSGTVTFASGVAEWPVQISYVGDTRPEGHEQYEFRLLSAQGAVLASDELGPSYARILDDDPWPVRAGLAHGVAVRGALAQTDPSGLAVDFFSGANDPFQSYEVVVDEVARGDGPFRVLLERNGNTQAFGAYGTGGSMRLTYLGPYINPQAIPRFWVEGKPGARYRIRAYETTLRGGRWDHRDGLESFVILQNPSSSYSSGSIVFWYDSGGPFPRTWWNYNLAPHASLVLRVRDAFGGPGDFTHGTVTVTSSVLTYGTLTGKTVLMDLRNGFVTESLLLPKPR